MMADIILLIKDTHTKVDRNRHLNIKYIQYSCNTVDIVFFCYPFLVKILVMEVMPCESSCFFIRPE